MKRKTLPEIIIWFIMACAVAGIAIGAVCCNRVNDARQHRPILEDKVDLDQERLERNMAAFSGQQMMFYALLVIAKQEGAIEELRGLDTGSLTGIRLSEDFLSSVWEEGDAIRSLYGLQAIPGVKPEFSISWAIAFSLPPELVQTASDAGTR